MRGGRTGQRMGGVIEPERYRIGRLRSGALDRRWVQRTQTLSIYNSACTIYPLSPSSLCNPSTGIASASNPQIPHASSIDQNLTCMLLLPSQ